MTTIAVGVLAYVAKGDDELGFAVVVGALGAVMAAWTYRTRSRAAAILSLVLGVLWTLLFAGFVIADFTGDSDGVLVRIGDILGVVGGLMILAGAIGRLRRAGRTDRE